MSCSASAMFGHHQSAYSHPAATHSSSAPANDTPWWCHFLPFSLWQTEHQILFWTIHSPECAGTTRKQFSALFSIQLFLTFTDYLRWVTWWCHCKVYLSTSCMAPLWKCLGFCCHLLANNRNTLTWPWGHVTYVATEFQERVRGWFSRGLRNMSQRKVISISEYVQNNYKYD